MAADAPNQQQQQQAQQKRQQSQKQQQQGQGDDEDPEQQNDQQEEEAEASGPEIPAVEIPKLDRSGNRPQRTVQQQHKQDELVKSTRRIEGKDSNHSRSASRRARRKRIEKDQQDGKYMHTSPLEALEEADANNESKIMRPFERIGPDSTAMDGPVTMARAERGEIPMRGIHPGQPYYNDPSKDKGKLDETDGLKLTLEANLDIEIELRASIRGDLTLSLMA